MPVLDLLNSHTVTIKKINPQISGWEPVEAWVNRSTGNSARIVPIGGRSAFSLLGRFPTAAATLYVLDSVEIYEGDRIYDELNKDEDGQYLRYEVLSVGRFFSEVGDHKECVLGRVEIDPT